MPLFIDRHDLSGATAADVAAAHVDDVRVQGRYGVQYVTYWFDYDRQRAFCLASGPDRDFPCWPSIVRATAFSRAR